MTEDMHKGHVMPMNEAMSMTGSESMSGGSSMEEMEMVDYKPMIDEMAMGGHGQQEQPATAEDAFTCPACGAGFGTRAELEKHGRSAH